MQKYLGFYILIGADMLHASRQLPIPVRRYGEYADNTFLLRHIVRTFAVSSSNALHNLLQFVFRSYTATVTLLEKIL